MDKMTNSETVDAVIENAITTAAELLRDGAALHSFAEGLMAATLLFGSAAVGSAGLAEWLRRVAELVDGQHEAAAAAKAGRLN